MKKGLFVLGITAAVFTGCSNQEVMDMAEYANQPIEFTTFVDKNTRSGDVTQSNFKKFWVFAQNKASESQEWADAFTNVQVNKIGDNNWQPINTYYWEVNKEFRFAGYANGESQLDNTNVSYDAGSTNDGSNSGLLTFKEYSTNGKNDLVAAMGNENNYTWNGSDGEAPAVGMTFRHMLSKLTFTFKTQMANTYKVAVSNLRIESATNKSTGTYHKSNNGTIKWNSDGLSNYQGIYTFENIPNVTVDAANEQGYFSQMCAPLYVIPQSCGTLQVKFTAKVTNSADEMIGQQDFIATLSYQPGESETGLQKDTWTAGYYYNYTAELKLEEINTDPNAKPISFDVTVKDWKPTTPGEDLGLTENNTQQ